MPSEIPTFRQRTEVPRAQGARIPLSAAGRLGDVLSALGTKVEELAKKKDESESLTTAQNILNETRLGVESDLDTLRRSGMGSSQFQKDSLSVFKKWQDQASERAQDLKTPEAADYLARKLGEFSVTTQIALGDEFDKKFRDEQRAGVLMQVPGIEARAIRARNPAEMQAAVDELRSFLGSHTNYALTVEEASKTYLESVDNIREQRVRDAILADPVGGLNILGSKEGANLRPEQVDRLTRFATAQINAAEAKERREEARQLAIDKRKQKVTESALTRDIIRGKDITAALLDPERSGLDGESLRALVNFQRSYVKEAISGPSDPAQLLRWRIAARSGRDPETGRRITWSDVTKARGLNSKDKGDVIEKLFDRQEAAEGKALTLRDRKRGRGENQIRLLLSGKDGLLAQITGSSGESFNDLNLYEALMEYDATVERERGRDPMDIADEVGFKFARNVITRFAGSSKKILDAYNVQTLDELLDKAEAGEIPRAQADQILRLGKFLQKADPKPTVTPPAGGDTTDPAEDDGKGAFDAVKKFFRDQLYGPGSDRSKTPSK